MSQLFRDAVTAPGGGSLLPSTGLGMNLYKTADGYIMQALLPGMHPDRWEITARENVLTVQGRTAIAAPENACALRERR
jgi:HSP20 family molecular chaperone IbpA